MASRSIFAWVLASSATLAGCVAQLGVGADVQVGCDSDADCPEPLVCLSERGQCVSATDPCVERVGDAYHNAADGNGCGAAAAGTICLAGACVISSCGDGFVDRDRDEACDDGVANSDSASDACRVDCQPARCGDGTIDVGRDEECDDGNAGDDDGCLATCIVNVCGDGHADGPGGEACDDGNDSNEDACRVDCIANVCGDGLRNLASEACDDGRLDVDGVAVPDANPNDGCAACQEVLWTSELVFEPGAFGGGPLALALTLPWGVAVDRLGSVYVADSIAGRVLKVSASGVVTRVAGLEEPYGATASGGELGPPNGIYLEYPVAVAVDASGNVFIADSNGRRVFQVCFSPAGCGGIAYGQMGTVAGGGTAAPADGSATAADLGRPEAVAVDRRGNLYIATIAPPAVRRVCLEVQGCGSEESDAYGGISTLLGVPYPDPYPDPQCYVDRLGGLVDLVEPSALVVDADGTVFVADANLDLVCAVVPGTDGEGVVGSEPSAGLGDGGPAAQATLSAPSGLAFDAAGNLLVLDSGQPRLRRVFRQPDGVIGNIETVAGTGAFGFRGDSGPASAARFGPDLGLAVDGAGNPLIADAQNLRIRLVCLTAGGCGAVADGAIDTLIGGAAGGEGRQATSASVSLGDCAAVDSRGNSLLCDGHRVRMVCNEASGCGALAQGEIGTLAGNSNGFAGDGGPAVAALFFQPGALAVDAADNLYVADTGNRRVRKICRDPAGCGTAATGEVETIAGNGSSCTAAAVCGDGAAATAAPLHIVTYLAVDGSGNVYISGGGADRIRQVCVQAGGCGAIAAGNIGTIAGDGTECADPLALCGDGGAATSAQLRNPQGIAVDAQGNLYIADRDDFRVRKVCREAAGCGSVAFGEIATIAGTGVAAYTGDGAAASAATFLDLSGLAADAAGNLYIADKSVDGSSIVHGHVRQLCQVATGCGAIGAGDIDSIAGTFAPVFSASGDGDSPTNAVLATTMALAVDLDTNIVFSDDRFHSLRRICRAPAGCGSQAMGTIEALAGSVFGAGDGPFSTASLADPRALAWLDADRLVVPDGSGGRLRLVDFASQSVSTGLGHSGGFDRYLTDPVDPDRALLHRPLAVLAGAVVHTDFLGVQQIFTSEVEAHSIRRVTLVDPAAPSTWTVQVWASQEISTDAEALRDWVDGPRAAARFDHPAGLAVDLDAELLYVADSGNHAVRAIDLSSADAGVSTLAGVAGSRGYAGDGGDASLALFDRPTALALGPGPSLYVADTGNQRVRRIDLSVTPPLIDTVLGDGFAASGGAGLPARDFSVDTPGGLRVDAFGNLFVTSHTAVREVDAGLDGIADGDDRVRTIYGAAPRDTFPASDTYCLADVSTDRAGGDDGLLYLVDACQGLLIRLQRVP